MVQTRPIREQQLLEAARQGDGRAFSRLVAPHRDRLRSRCYRVLHSDDDADDALQEALVRAWRGLPGFDGGSAVGPWLHRIATNSSLDALQKRRRTVPIDPAADPDAADADGATGGPASPVARYEQREAVELAFVAATELLPARQRAALILSEALGFSAREAAEALDTTTTSIYSAVQRARRIVADRGPERAEQTALRSLDDEGLKAAGEQFARAMERADVEAILTILSAERPGQGPAKAARSDCTRACEASRSARTSRSLFAAASI